MTKYWFRGFVTGVQTTVDGRYFERTMDKNSSLVRGSSRKTPTIINAEWMGNGRRVEGWPDVGCKDADHHAGDGAALRLLNASHRHAHVSARKCIIPN